MYEECGPGIEERRDRRAVIDHRQADKRAYRSRHKQGSLNCHS